MIRTIDTSPVRIPSGAPREAWSMSSKRLLPSNDTPNVQAENRSTVSTVVASTVSPIAEPTSPAQPEKPEPDDDGAKFTASHTEGESKGYDGPENNTPPQALTPKNNGRKCRASGTSFCRFRPGRPETSPPVALATSDFGSEESKRNEETGVKPSTTVCRICFCVALLAILGIFIIIGIMRINSNKYDDYVCHGQKNGSGPSTPDDSRLCPSPSLDVDYPPTISTHPTEEPALDSNAAAGEDAAERVEKTMDVGIKKSGFSLPPQLTGRNSHVGTSRIQSERPCWIYMHMDKSGTNVVRNIVTERWQRDQRSFDSAQWRRGDDHAADVMTNSRWRLLHGGCVEALRRYEVDRETASETELKQENSCAWFTVLRNPVARMISAFDHCQKASRDPLCGPVQATDLEHFAEYWGNFCLRQFAMALVLWSDVKGWAARPGGPRDRSSTWYMLKQYFNRQSLGGEISEEMLLEPTKQILSTAYTAIGIEEDMEATMTLFNKVLFMPDVDWVGALRDHSAGEHDGDVVEASRLELALANPRIVDALKLDILLYEHAVAIFREQVAL